MCTNIYRYLCHRRLAPKLIRLGTVPKGLDARAFIHNPANPRALLRVGLGCSRSASLLVFLPPTSPTEKHHREFHSGKRSRFYIGAKQPLKVGP